MKYLLIFFITFLIFDCSSYPKSLIADGSENQAIKNVIIDFTNTSRLYKKNSVFKVVLIDTLYSKVLDEIDELSYQWIDDKPYGKIIAIRVAPVVNEYSYFLSDSLKIRNDFLPSRYIEQDGKLFFWKDKKFKVNDETIKILKKYKVVSECDKYPVYITDESLKAVHYYMCRKNFTKFKKITTSSGIGYYDVPIVECE